MKIWISSLRDVHDAHAKAAPAKIVSLLSPGSDFPDFADYCDKRHHRIEIHDILEDREDRAAPGEAHVETIISHLRDWTPDQSLLVHCWAGMSRSTATAFIAACLHNPGADEALIGAALGSASPTAFPNTRIVAIADEMLGRDGRMARAAERLRKDEARLAEIYRVQEASPFFIPSRY
ncbi:MAG: protein tyrosine phosphatase [Pseudomonadota bacterium]